MSTGYNGLTTSPSKLKLLAFDGAAELGGLDGGPERLGDLVDDLESTITA